MSNFKTRLVTEVTELDEKIAGLTSFLEDSVVFDTLDNESKVLLELQLSTMKIYSTILHKRIVLVGL